MKHVVVIGGGLAGGNAAAGLRDEGYDGRITVITDEPGVPFGRPPLSKTYLRGEEPLSDWFVKPPEWYGASGVALHSGRAVRVDAPGGRVVLADDSDLACDAVVIATGARARKPPTDLPNVFTLRRREDADAIRSAGRRCAVVGMSFIGSEVAASLRQIGVDVVAVFPGSGPLASVLGDVVAARMSAIHREHGVELVADDKVLEYRDGAVATEKGRTIECDFVVVGLGVEPNVEIGEASGLETDNGIVVDAHCRTTVDNVYAVGDVAAHDHPRFGRVRVEHYNNAEKQGRYVASALLGRAEPYDYLHTFWSDQYDHKIEYVGHTRKWDEFVLRGDPQGGFIGFYLVEDVVRAVVGVDRGGDPELEPDSEMAACARLVGRRVDRSTLA